MSDPRGEGPSEAAGEPPRLEEVTLEPGAVPKRALAVRAGGVSIQKGDEVGRRMGESLVAEERSLGAESGAALGAAPGGGERGEWARVREGGGRSPAPEGRSEAF
eukprot:1103813-Prorocentrum_lima.AAC.1